MQSNQKRFELIDASYSNIKFRNTIEENFNNFFAQFNYVYNGAGVSAGDINNDGLADLLFIGNEVPNKLYLNKGDFIFEDISENAGVGKKGGWHNGVNFIDLNADGFLDIYICRGGWKGSISSRRNLLYINDGNLGFAEKAKEYGLDDPGYSMQASFFDKDNDGDLDMYLINRPSKFFLGIDQVLEGKQNPIDESRDKLYENRNGKFHDVSKDAGISNFAYGLGISTSDINKDGLVDIYIANDYLENDFLYINNGDGTFTDKIKEYSNHVAFYAMGVDASDLNNDGWEDIVELEMLPEDYVRSKTTMAAMNVDLFDDMIDNGFHHQYMHNMLHLNRGRVGNDDVFFSEISQYAGISSTDWSWACLAQDFDNDGLRDIFISNGFKRDIFDKDGNQAFKDYMKDPNNKSKTNEQKAQYIINLFKSNKIPNYLYKNTGDLKFQNVASQWGLNQETFSNGAVSADLDNDGDLDLIVNNIDAEPLIYKNNTQVSLDHYLKVKLEGPEWNPHGLNAKITVSYKDKQLYQDFRTTRGYLSSVEPIAHFGLGKYNGKVNVSLQWLDGTVSSLTDIESNQTLTIKHADAQTKIPKNESPKPLLLELTEQYLKELRHSENDFDDFEKQVLLPHKLSTLGPALAVGDVDGDGDDDFFLGGAHNSKGLIFKQESSEFKVSKQTSLNEDKAHEDVDATFVDIDNDGDLDLYVVSGGNEFETGSELYSDRLYLNDGEGNFNRSSWVDKQRQSGGVVMFQDFDENGYLDLFIGARLLPGSYPASPKSYLLLNKEGYLGDAISYEMGMLADATWTEEQRLMVVGEWTDINLYKFEGDGFVDVSSELKIGKQVGWWNSIDAIDLEKNDTKAYVLGNIGDNYKYKADSTKGFMVYADDFDDNGSNDIFLAKPYKDQVVPIRGRECSSEQVPEIANRFTTYNSFAQADILDILEDTSGAVIYKANNFSTSLLSKREGKWVLSSLPFMSQFSAVNVALSLDVNNDGRNDIVLAGNRFESEIETTRADAGVGLVILNLEDGLFPQTIEESGLFVPYNVKKMVKIRVENERKIGFLVGSNNDFLRLYVVNSQ